MDALLPGRGFSRMRFCRDADFADALLSERRSSRMHLCRNADLRGCTFTACVTGLNPQHRFPARTGLEVVIVSVSTSRHRPSPSWLPPGRTSTPASCIQVRMGRRKHRCNRPRGVMMSAYSMRCWTAAPTLRHRVAERVCQPRRTSRASDCDQSATLKRLPAWLSARLQSLGVTDRRDPKIRVPSIPFDPRPIKNLW
jgi:hypothetical protein